MLQLHMDIPELAALRARLRQAPAMAGEELELATVQAGELVRAEVVARTPVGSGPDSGRLARSIGVQFGHVGGGTYARIGGDLPPYARYVEFGTRPHEINARGARALRFNAGGKTVFARRVHHPGTKPVRMFRDGFAAAQEGVIRLYRLALRRAARRLAGR